MTEYGNWEVIRRLGEGGQGVVYLASDKRAFDRKAILDRITRARLPSTSTQEHLDEAAADLAKAVAEYGKREDPQSCGALKILHTPAQGAALEKQLDRMKAEIEALRSLDHPSIIRILDQNLDQRWFVMQYFPAGPLSQHISKFAGNFLAALMNFRPLVEAVAEMHRENIFLSSDQLLLAG